MGIFENFPYTNFHELNLDWILSTIKELDSEIDEFVQTNVLTYADPIQWDITTQYAKNTVVVGPDGTAYMSIAPVPTNILLTNTDYWQPIFNYSETVTVLKKQIAAADMGDSKTALVSVPLGGLFWKINTLYRAKKAISAGDGFVTGSNCELCTVEEAIKNVIAPASDIGRSGKNVTDSAVETVKRTGRNIIDSATGDYTETSDHKTVEAAQITEHITANREIDVNGANSVHIDGTNTVNVGGDHTEVYAKTYGKRITGKHTVNFDGGSEEIHKTKGKIVAPDFELAIANGLTYKKPAAFNDYFSTVPMKDTDGNVYQVLVSNDGTSGLGSAAPYHSFKEFGIDNTGNMDCSDALSGVTDNVALSAGTYLIGKNCTINCELVFAKGAILSISAGVTVTINGVITAPDTQIFNGDGNVVISCIANASWFPTINKAFASITSGTLYITKEFSTNTAINITNSIRVIGLNKTSAIVTDANLPTLLNIGGTPENKLVYVYLNNLKVRNNGECAINIHDCSFSIFEDMHAINSTIGIKITNTNSCKLIYPIVESVIGKSQTGIYIDCADYTNNSLYITGCSILENNNPSKKQSTGITIDGSKINDLWLDSCETSQCNLGLAIMGKTANEAYDINIRNCVFDHCLSCGMQLKSLKGSPFSSCVIENCYIVMAAGATIQSINVNDCENIVVNNLVCYNTGNTGIDAIDCKNMTISNSIVILNSGYGIVTEGATKNFCITSTHVINKGAACDIGLALRGSYNIASDVLFTGLFNAAVLNDGSKDIISNIVGEQCTNVLQDTSGNSLHSNIMTN